MASFYADENFDYPAVEELRLLGHDVLTAQEAGQANQKIPDGDVLAFAISQSRCVVTYNRRDFRKLHRTTPNHTGIVICTRDDDAFDLASRIHAEVSAHASLRGILIRVNRPAKP